MQSGPDGDVHIGEKCSVVGFVQESMCCLTRFPPWGRKGKREKKKEGGGLRASSILSAVGKRSALHVIWGSGSPFPSFQIVSFHLVFPIIECYAGRGWLGRDGRVLRTSRASLPRCLGAFSVNASMKCCHFL